VAARRYHDDLIPHPFGEPFSIIDRRFPEPTEIADLGASALDRASAHSASGAGVKAELLRNLGDERGPDQGRRGWEAPRALEKLQEQRKVETIRAAPGVAQFAFFSGESPRIKIAIDRRVHRAPPVHSTQSAAGSTIGGDGLNPCPAVAGAMPDAVQNAFRLRSGRRADRRHVDPPSASTFLRSRLESLYSSLSASCCA